MAASVNPLPHRTVRIREKRRGSIAAYAGLPRLLALEGRQTGLVQRVRTFTQDTPSDLLRALALLRTIRGGAIVVHGPAGCAASLGGGFNTPVPWTVTGIDQRDSIMGGDRKLRRALLQIHAEHAPRVIFVVATPVVAINNDDIESVVSEVNAELGVPILPVLTDGFRSKLAGSGYDAVVHALLREHLWHGQGAPGPHLNLLSIAEHPDDVAELRGLLLELGTDPVVFPRHGDAEQFHRVPRARLSVAIDPDESEYAGSVLQQHGVPFLAQGVPVGVAATGRWLAGVGAALGLEARAAEVIRRHEAALAAWDPWGAQGAQGAQGGPQAALARHRGTRVFLHLPAALAFALLPVLEDFGLEPAGLSLTALAQTQDARLQELAERHPELPLLVGEGQVFEEVNLLQRLRPDLYLGLGNAAVHALRLGIPVLDLQHLPVLGYAGVRRLTESLARALDHPALAQFLAEPADHRYTQGWLDKSTHWFIKHEVR